MYVIYTMQHVPTVLMHYLKTYVTITMEEFHDQYNIRYLSLLTDECMRLCITPKKKLAHVHILWGKIMPVCFDSTKK